MRFRCGRVSPSLLLVVMGMLIMPRQTARAQDAPVATVAVAGRVISPDGGSITGAEIRIRGSALSALSDSAGAFEIRRVAPGKAVIDARRIGFKAQEFPIELASGRDRHVVLTLPVVAQLLPEINVDARLAKPARYANTHRYDLFYERRAHGNGVFLTREDIDLKFKTNTAELLQTISGVKVRRIGNEWKVQFGRCQMGVPGATDPSTFISIFINGHRVGRGDQLNSINPSEIEAMEVYRSPAELPPEARGEGCGAVFVWLRNGS